MIFFPFILWFSLTQDLCLKEYVLYKAGKTHLEITKIVECIERLSQSAWAKGQKEIALTYAQDLLTLEPKNPWAKTIQKLMEEKKKNPPKPSSISQQAMLLSEPVLGTRHFRIHLRGSQDYQASDKILVWLDEAYRTVGAQLGLYPEDPLDTILYSNVAFQQAWGAHPNFQGFYDGRIHIPLGKFEKNFSRLRQVIFHEYTHALLYHLTRNRAPRWLHEGLAQVMEPEPLEVSDQQIAKAYSQIGSRFLTDKRVWLSLGSNQTHGAYLLAYWCAKYLLEKEGPYTLQRYLKALREGKAPQRAFQEVYLYPLKELPHRAMGR